ncbi:MAG: hypothetical protein QW035_01930 [Candidatus Anstonellales archaeon]
MDEPKIIDDIGKLEGEIAKLEERKKELIEKIKEVNRRVLYKKYELKALEPFLKETSEVNTLPIRKTISRLEFKLSTQGYTLKREREIVKMIKSLEKELKKIEPIEKARKKKRFIEKDLQDLGAQAEEIEKQLKEIRENIADLQKKRKEMKKDLVRRKRIEDTELVSLEDVVVIEKEEN